MHVMFFLFVVFVVICCSITLSDLIVWFAALRERFLEQEKDVRNKIILCLDDR